MPDEDIRVGIDAVTVERVRRLLADHEGCERELFTARELEYCDSKRRRHEHLAARFAAKEAVLKAFGTGMSRSMRFTEVEVVNERGGRPAVVLDGAVAAFAERNGLRQLDISLTHTEGLALAQAVAVWERESACAST